MRRGGALLLFMTCGLVVTGDARSASPAKVSGATPCEGARPALPQSLFYELRAGAFPGSGRPDVAVHVPAGFDATRRPGVVVYFHGWSGCVQAALGDDDVPCSDGGEVRVASHLAAQLDAARVNAVLVAVELRADMPTGEPGQLATLGGLRALLKELFDEHLAAALGDGCSLEVDALDRVVVIAHSGGYRAAATVIGMGDVPSLREVALLDALYGADEVFARWVVEGRLDASRRFVDLYTCCGGTLERSRVLATLALGASPRSSLDDDGDSDLGTAELERPFVFKRVPLPHGELPAAYVRPLLETAGFAPLPR